MKLFKLSFMFSLSFALTLSELTEKSKRAYQASLVHIKHTFHIAQDITTKYTGKATKCVFQHGKVHLGKIRDKVAEASDSLYNYVKRKFKKQDEAPRDEEEELEQDAGEDFNEDDMMNDEMFKNMFGGDEFKEFYEMLKNFGDQKHGEDKSELSKEMENEDEISLEHSEDEKKEEELVDVKQDL